MTGNREFPVDNTLRCYDVCVGHLRVTVQALAPPQAIEAARKKLCAELPRLWDVISQMDAQQFEVTPRLQAG